MFEDRQNYSNYIDAIDDKHILIKQSIAIPITLLLEGVQHRFISHCKCRVFVRIRWMQWKISEDGVCRNSSLYDTMQSNLLNILKPRLLDHGETVLPFVIVGHPAFPLKQNLMKPYLFQALSYKKRTFNHILTRAKRIEENRFGILPNLF